MRPYQAEYLDNLRQFAILSQRKRPGELTCEEYATQMAENRAQIIRLGRRNMELLRTGLFPVLDNLFDAGEEDLKELEEFSFQLFDARRELDVGLFCQIRQALLTLARQKKDRNAMIRELYWLGMGRNSLCSKLVGLPLSDVAEYMTHMRLCFAEAAAYLKYFDEIGNTETQGYIIRARANMSLGQFNSPGEKIQLVRHTLEILQDTGYQKAAPGLPWERFLYLTHQNMTSSTSHSRENTMSPEDIASIMESAYIVYTRRFQEAQTQGSQPPAKSAFGYYTIEFYCGLYGLDTLLQNLEDLLDAADPADYSADGMYSMISLPAFYSQYLSQYPDQIPPRTEYIQSLYRRMLDYADAYPKELSGDNLFLYLRQLCFTFIETDGGLSYGEFLLRLMPRFAPEIYRHSHIVGEAAKALCAAIMDDDPSYFDDIDFIRAIADPGEKRQAVLDYAMGCGVFHDVGKISVIELYNRTARQWFENEYEMAHLHTLAGQILLEPRPSTSRYAPAALGHHAWYDGTRGYPSSYKRLECPERQMVDIIGLVDWLEIAVNSNQAYNRIEQTFEEAVLGAAELEGTRFSPLLTARLRDAQTAELLKRALETGAQNAYLQMYDGARQSKPPKA
ncbi:MAG: hypothetical protein K2M42_10530 [Oscillospiraceae bacterium]|nr:hypothetical protein [Oscillospiraceae bacterium]